MASLNDPWLSGARIIQPLDCNRKRKMLRDVGVWAQIRLESA